MIFQEKEKLISVFKDYLETENMRMNTVRIHSNSVHLFLDWCFLENIEYQYVTYVDLLAYIDYMKKIKNQQRTILCKIQGVKHLYKYLQKEGIIEINPCEELKLRGRITTLPSNLLDWNELEAIYEYYPTANLTGKRNKVIVGLMIYQGLTSGEIERLRIQDVDLERGKIYIEGKTRSNDRTLKLEPVQILYFQKYINQTRRIIQDITGNQSEHMFSTLKNSPHFANSLKTLMVHAKKLNSKVKNPVQIRASVLTHWLKKYNIREVQYMAGHRYVSSTERYQTTKLEGLQELINQLHPLK